MSSPLTVAFTGGSGAEALLLRLQRRFSERETLHQLPSNTVGSLLNPVGDVPSADEDCGSTDLGM